MEKWFTEILFTQEQIENKINELAQWVDDTYKNSKKELILIGIMKGSIPFLAQLIKSIKKEHILDFMTVSTYEGGTHSKGNVKIITDLAHAIKNKDVLLVEDIVDSGITLKHLVDYLKLREPASLRTITLLNKKKGRTTKFEVDKYGFDVPHKFLAGFGLDVKEKLRGAPFIGVFDKSKINKL